MSKATTSMRSLSHSPHALEGAAPCDDCPKAERCRAGLACAALSLFINTGRFSAVAPGCQAAMSICGCTPRLQRWTCGRGEAVCSVPAVLIRVCEKAAKVPK
jgi:hypothetical protein